MLVGHQNISLVPKCELDAAKLTKIKMLARHVTAIRVLKCCPDTKVLARYQNAKQDTKMLSGSNVNERLRFF